MYMKCRINSIRGDSVGGVKGMDTDNVFYYIFGKNIYVLV